MQAIFERVSMWNAARYEQEFNLELAVKLLREEYAAEWLQHVTKLSCMHTHEKELYVKLLDDLADICYVAFGICWKVGATWQDICAAQERVLQAQMIGLEAWPQIRPGYFIGALIDSFEFDNELGVIDSMLQIINCCGCEAMYTLSVTPEQFERACMAVCISNDSKSVQRVAADVKANAGNKGPYYIAPDIALRKIIDEVNYD